MEIPLTSQFQGPVVCTGYKGIFIGGNVMGRGFILPPVLYPGLRLFYFKQHKA